MAGRAGRTSRGAVLARVMLAVVLASYMCIPSPALARPDEGAPSSAASERGDAADAASADAAAADDAPADDAPAAESSSRDDGLDSDAGSSGSSASKADLADDPDASPTSDAPSEGPSAETVVHDKGDSPQGVDGEEAPIDVSADWKAGKARIVAGGQYVLSADVKAGAPLEVKLPRGASATVDLAGFAVTVGGEANCAVDLSENAGTVTFTDSAYDDKHPEKLASIALKATDKASETATVRVVRTPGTRDAKPMATFEHVRLQLDVTARSAGSYEAAAAVVKTGVDPKGDEEWKVEDETVGVELRGCALVASTRVDADSGTRAEIASTQAVRGATSIVDAGCRGIVLDGPTSAALEIDGAEALSVPMLLSAYEGTYTLRPGLKLVRAGDGGGKADPALVFGFPSAPASGEAGEAVVARAAEGESIPDGAASGLKAPAGYEARLERAAGPDGNGGGYEKMSLVRAAVDEAGQEPEGQPEGDSGEDAAESLAADAEEAVDDDPAATEVEPAVVGLAGSRPHVYASYVAENAGSVVYADKVTTQADGVDLNATWAAQDNGTDAAYTISSGGVYYLSADLATGSNLVIDAEGKDVTLRFDGHKLTIDGDGSSSQKSLVSIVAAKSVAFDGSAEGSALVSAGELDVWGITSSAPGCAVSATGLAVKLASTSTQQRNLNTHCIRMVAGSLALDGCAISMNMANQTLTGTGLLGTTDYEVPSAVYATSDVSSVVLTDCTVVGEGPSGFSLSDISDATAIGNAYAVYSLASSTRIEGGSYKAVSVRGNATCLYGSSLEVAAGSKSAKVELEADAGQLATGVLSLSAGSVALNAPLSLSVDGDYDGAADVVAMLRSSVQSGFVFGDCAPASGSYSALVMTGGDLAEANAVGFYLGAFASGLAADARAALLGVLEDALGDEGSCSVDADLAGVKFVFDESKKAATVTDAAGSTTTSHPTVGDAIARLAAVPGGTLALCRDADAVAVPSVTDGTIDLKGYDVASLSFTASGSGAGLTIADSVGGGVVGGGTTAVTYDSPMPLTLDGVAVEADGVDLSSYGVSAAQGAGKLTLTNGATVRTTASRVCSTAGVYSYGIYVPLTAATGPEMVIELGSSVSSRALTTGVSAYGMYSPNSAKVSDSAVSASGVAVTVCAAYIGGVLEAKGSTFDAQTADVATTACDVQLRTSSPQASSVALEDCTLRVRSDVGASALSDAIYSCVLGSTSESGTSAPTDAITLSGANNVFSCVGATHLGMNLGKVVVDDGFGLASASDKPLVISQAKNTDSIGMWVDGTPTSALASLFEAKGGSYYDGWALFPDTAESRLVWHPADYVAGAGVVEVTHSGVTTAYASLGDALDAALTGDTVKLLADISESDAQSVTQRSLTLDLNGKTLSIRAGADAAAGNDGSGGALRYTGAGTLSVKDTASSGGKIDIKAGAATEPSSGATYQGISVSGKGTLTIDAGVAVNVAYAGSTSSSAAQRAVVLRGIAVPSGGVNLNGTLTVKSASADGEIGAMEAYGLFSEPTSGNQAIVSTGSNSLIQVKGLTAVDTTSNTYYAESTSTQASPVGVREIKVDPTVDADFYNDIADLFRATATYDDPDDSTLRNVFGARIYFAQNMQLDHDGKWYDGLKVWAFSDEVTGGDVGKMASIVPDHIFISTHYDTLPNAYGIASGSGSGGTASFTVNGAVDAECSHGNAYAVSACKADSGAMNWTCNGSTLSATADDKVHPIAQGAFDLRDFIDFSSTTQTKKVAYSNVLSSQLVRFEPTIARDAVVSEGVLFTLNGESTFAANGLDSAVLETSSYFRVRSAFSLSSSSETCSVANSSGANAVEDTFARPISATIDPSWFSDAYGSCTVGVNSSGWAYWAQGSGYSATFKVGDAVVARYASPASVDLSQPSAVAQLASDQRQTYALAGWSQNPDERATSGYLGTSDVISPTSDCVYYAVFDTGLVTVPVTFDNIYDSHGSRLASVAFTAEYGATVGEMLEDPANAGKALPVPADYEDSSYAYRFIGWYPCSNSATTASQVYSSEQVRDLKVTLSLDGMASNGSLTLRAMYLAVKKPTQHLVTFVVDSRTSACVVEDGVHPTYTAVNSSNSNYVVPSKVDTETGKTFTFTSWFRDSDGDGVLDEGEAGYTSVLPKATEDVTYTASWSYEWSDVTLTFHVRLYDATTGKLNDNGLRVITTTYEEKTQKVADSIATVGSKIGVGGKVYTLEGWSPRSSDVEAVYDADNPLPDVAGDDRALSSAYAKTYYGVYSTSDHMVTATFYNGGQVVGSAKVSGLKTIDEAFAATGAATPADQSTSAQFLGWATSSTATEELDGVSVTLEDVVGATAETVSFYAVYGTPRIYTIRLRSEDGKSVLYKISVRRGRTVNEAAKAAGVTVSPAAVSGKYFSGWRTAAGEYYSLDKAVTGSADLYASYKQISVTTKDSGDIAATVASTLSKFEETASLAFSIVPRTSADSPLRESTSKYGYTILKSYDLRLKATDSSGKASVVTGDFGTADLTVYVGRGYRNSKVRVFWLGSEGSGEKVFYTAVLTVDSKGYVTLSVGNYTVGDEDEGGNLCVAYVEGGASDSKLTNDDSSSGLSSGDKKSSDSGDSGTSGSDGDNGDSDDSSSSGDSDGDSSGLSSSGGTLSVSQLSLSASSGLSLAKASSGLATSSGKSGKSNGSAALGAASGSASKSDGDATGEDGSEAAEEEDSSFFSDWNSDAVALVVLAAIALAAMVYGLWRLVVVRQRRNEAEAELPVMSNRYAKGIRF